VVNGIRLPRVQRTIIKHVLIATREFSSDVMIGVFNIVICNIVIGLNSWSSMTSFVVPFHISCYKETDKVTEHMNDYVSSVHQSLASSTPHKT
jgi:hypothetical protein